MKRVLTFLAIMLLPLSVMAMTPVSDQTLSDVTGQAGVNINADLMMDIAIGTMAWGDSDGILNGGHPLWGTTDGGGYVGVTGFDIDGLRIKARETDAFDGYAAPAQLKPITIDVATDPNIYDGATFVRFGLGSLQITMGALDFDVRLGTDAATLAASGNLLGVVSIGAMGIYIDPKSYVDIFSDGTCGVNIAMDIEIDQFNIGYVSWGDTDGVTNTGMGAMPWMAAASAGYVGLANLEIGGPITVSGQLAIDVNTAYAGIYSHGIVGTDAGAAPVSVVHIQFGSDVYSDPTLGAADLFSVLVGPITAEVKLDGVAALDGANAGTLGDIYISGFGLDIYGGSWVDIWAH
ncbi:MAG TPA: hypothetical protein PK764_11470 [Deltaproteobacteria bacterium]|nr:hypothetical protein [Deltaproteobacteria bacterium]